jgi:intracellular multiplication protein IcmC
MSIIISTNLISSLLEVEKLLTASAYLIGLSFIFKALYSLKTYAETKSHMSGSQGGVKESIVYFFVGGMLLYFPTGFAILMNTTFGYSTVLAYAPVTSGSPLISTLFGEDSLIGYALALMIQVIGGTAFIRGWVLISRSASSGQPPGALGQGLTHICGGILAMNIIGTLQVIQNTLFVI